MAKCIVCGDENITDQELENCEKEGTFGIYCNGCLIDLKRKWASTTSFNDKEKIRL